MCLVFTKLKHDVRCKNCRQRLRDVRRSNFKPIVTICYEFLKHILESLPNENNSDGVTPADAAVGQFFWVTLHEAGHATFDILDVPARLVQRAVLRRAIFSIRDCSWPCLPPVDALSHTSAINVLRT
jgi:Putative metallopeptidase